MKYFSSITLNDITYKKEQLISLTSQKLNTASTPAWEKSIYNFISELINDEEYIIAQSSGTTGKAKQIRLKKRDLVESALRTQTYFGLKPKNKALLCLPADYIAGKMMIVRAFIIGFNLICVKPTSKPFQKINDNIDFVALTPHQLFDSLNDLRNKNVNNIIVGGAHVSFKLLDILQDLPANIHETYGMTETCSHIAIKPLNGIHKSEYFQTLPGFKISKDEQECLVIKNKYGEIFHTKDIVEIIGNQFKWLGRLDNVINTGGIKLFPEQIEKKIEKLINHRFIITAEKNEKLGEQLILIIESNNPEMEISNLKDSMHGILSFYERPKKLYLLPKFAETPSGKIKRIETMKLIKGINGYVL